MPKELLTHGQERADRESHEGMSARGQEGGE